jgi:hypothetical protein
LVGVDRDIERDGREVRAAAATHVDVLAKKFQGGFTACGTAASEFSGHGLECGERRHSLRRHR